MPPHVVLKPARYRLIRIDIRTILDLLDREFEGELRYKRSSCPMAESGRITLRLVSQIPVPMISH